MDISPKKTPLIPYRGTIRTPINNFDNQLNESVSSFNHNLSQLKSKTRPSSLSQRNPDYNNIGGLGTQRFLASSESTTNIKEYSSIKLGNIVNYINNDALDSTLGFGYDSTGNQIRKVSSSRSPDLGGRLSQRLTMEARSTSKSNLGMDGSVKKPINFENNMLSACSSTTNLVERNKPTASFVNAMKALQTKIKGLEASLNEKDILLQKKNTEYESLKSRINEERQINKHLENNLRHNLELLEKELNNKQQVIENLNEENKSLRGIISRDGQDRNKEYEMFIHQKTNSNNRIHELEEELQHLMVLIDDGKKHLLESSQENEKLQDEIDFLQKRLMKQENDKNDLKYAFDEKIQDLLRENQMLERKIFELRTESEKDIRLNNQKEKNMLDEIEKLNREISDYKIMKEELDHYIKVKQKELIMKDEHISALKQELRELNREIAILKSSTKHIHNPIDKNQLSDGKLPNNVVEGIKIRETGRFAYGQEISEKKLQPSESQDKKSPRPRTISTERLLNDELSTEISPNNNEKFKNPLKLDLNNATDLSVNNYHSSNKNFSISHKESSITWEGISQSFSSIPKSKKNTTGWADNPSENSRVPETTLHPNNISLVTTKSKELPYNSVKYYSDNLSRGFGAQDHNQSETLELKNPLIETKQLNATKLNTSDETSEYERVIKDIIMMEKEILNLNKQYQGFCNQMNGKDDQATKNELLAKLQSKNDELIKLKTIEEQLLKRLKFQYLYMI